MKLLLIGLLSLSAVFANTYEFHIAPTSVETVSYASSGSYQLLSEVIVEIDPSVNYGAKTMNIVINGVSKTVPVYSYGFRREGEFTVTSFSSTLETFIIEDLTCDEREAIDYRISFKKRTSAFGSKLTEVRLTATHSFTRDWCHLSADETNYLYTLR